MTRNRGKHCLKRPRPWIPISRRRPDAPSLTYSFRREWSHSITDTLGDGISPLHYRLLTVIAIVVGLETLAIPIVMKLQKGMVHKAQKLVMEKLEGDMYRDATGKTYHVQELEDSL